MAKKLINRKPKNAAPKTEIEEIKDGLGAAITIKNLHDSEGGQILIDGLVSDILSAVDRISIENATLTMQEFVALGSRIKERMDILKVLTGAKKQKQIYEEILAEALKREEEDQSSV